MHPKRSYKTTRLDDYWRGSWQPDASSGPPSIPRLAYLPPELFDEIISYFRAFPSDWYYDGRTTGIPENVYAERTVTLRALACTCKEIRAVAYPRLWSRLDLCFTPTHARGTWYKYVMQNLKVKAEGLRTLDATTRGHIRAVTFTVTQYQLETHLPYVRTLLEQLPSIHSIQIIQCKVPAKFRAAIKGLSLPSVRKLIIPNETHALVSACPNVTHVRCAGGPGNGLIWALRGLNVEALDGMIDWCHDERLAQRLVTYAPHLTTLEIRHPVDRLSAVDGRVCTVPAEWATVIPALSGLKQLRALTLTLPNRNEVPTDAPIIDAAREVLRQSTLSGAKKLVVRRIEAPRYDQPPLDADLLVHSHTEFF